MWSRLTEYAAEIVAPPSDDGAQDAQIGDEIWSRFASIVAPPENGASPLQNDAENVDDEDEQEKYISELERALLQKKKQNEALEQKARCEMERANRGKGQRIRELEAATGGNATQNEDSAASTFLHEKDEHIARLEGELVTMAEQVEAMKRTGAETARENDAKESDRLREQVVALKKRVEELDLQCSVLDATLREERSVRGKTGDNENCRDADGDHNDADANADSFYPTLVQAALVLSKRTPSENGALEVGTTEAAVAAQLLDLAEATRRRIEENETQLAKLHAALVSFFKMHGVSVDTDGGAFFVDVQAKLGLVSHRLSKGEAYASKVVKLQQQLDTLADKEEKQQKTVLALQTQLSGVQASKLRNDASLASRESEIMAAVEQRDERIAKLQAYEGQLKQTLAHLGKELDDAHVEADELEKVCKAQQRELKKQQKLTEQVTGLEAENSELRERVQELERSAQQYEQGYLALLQEAEATKQKTEEEKAELVATTEAQVVSTEQQLLYDLQARLSASEADKLVAVQDAERLQTELDSLDKVLLQFRTDHKHQRERLLELEQALEDARRSKPQTTTMSSSAVSEEDFRRVMEVLSKRTQECEQLREALENSAKRFSSEAEVLDKSLAAQLVVSYLESDKKHEVLQLMSRMMGFTDEQKQRAGILGDGQVVIPGNGGGGLFSSIFGTHSSNAQDHDAADSSDTPSTTEGKNVNELWASFLIDEAKQ